MKKQKSPNKKELVKTSLLSHGVKKHEIDLKKFHQLVTSITKFIGDEISNIINLKLNGKLVSDFLVTVNNFMESQKEQGLLHEFEIFVPEEFPGIVIDFVMVKGDDKYTLTFKFLMGDKKL
jgi:hypothetical protein